LWVPAHRGVQGNERADTLAKQALERQHKTDILLSKAEVKTIIKRNIMKEWQHSWDVEETGRHLHAVQSEVGKGRPARRRTAEDNIVTRLRIGHTRLNKTMQGRGCKLAHPPEMGRANFF